MMLKATQVLRTAMSVLALSVGASALPAAALAQDAAAPAAAAPGAPPLGWFKTCSKQDDSDICVVQNIIAAQNGQIESEGIFTRCSGCASRIVVESASRPDSSRPTTADGSPGFHSG